jgi:UDP-N-acetylglucosamine--N-acetylmuramyl-(pentapeptide) pyrophosphoryl-undecaprenol N-acetylglucosamine transferase
MTPSPPLTGTPSPRLLIAASGTGGHVFPALSLAEQLPDYEIEWLGTPNRLETQLVPAKYPLHTVMVEGFQQRGLKAVRVFLRLIGAIFQVRRLLKQGKFQGVFTTGGYIAAPVVVAARSLGLPVILHEANALPGKVTRLLSRWCTAVAIGFAVTAQYLPQAQTVCVGTPVRSQFLDFKSELPDLPIPPKVPLLVIVGGSQGAVAINKLVRQCAPAWFAAGIWVVHQTGENDPDADTLHHPQYFPLPFYDHMAALLQRADLVIGRAGAGTLTELAITHTPSILIPYPYAAEDHQTYNARVFVEAEAAKLFQQADLTAEMLQTEVLQLLGNNDSTQLQHMAKQTATLAVPDSAVQLATLVRQVVKGN